MQDEKKGGKGVEVAESLFIHEEVLLTVIMEIEETFSERAAGQVKINK